MNPSTLRARRATNLRQLDRLELDRVATDLVVKYGSLILQDATRYSANTSDAEDAYQRSLEILLTKAPTTDPEQLIPWLRTVVRNEALAIAKSRHNTNQEFKPEHADAAATDAMPTADVVESFADLERGAEALQYLSPDQVTCLIAQSAGMNYDEIVELTGFTRRKVTRCIENGRHAFTRKVDAIAAGSECERMQPLIHRLVDADTEAAIELRPHLRHCIACRGILRDYDSAPRRVAALFPPSLVVVGYPSTSVFARIADWCQALADRISIQFLGAERWAEAAGVKKVAVVATIATATAGGGAAVHRAVERDRAPSKPAAAETRSTASLPARDLIDPIKVSRPEPRAVRKRAKRKHMAPQTVPQTEAPTPAPEPIVQADQPVDDGSAEFLPEERGSE
ncbi:MAG: sigma-70 family RNA polymerase sigma factor [Solirubrobacterales bacterium]